MLRSSAKTTRRTPKRREGKECKDRKTGVVCLNVYSETLDSVNLLHTCYRTVSYALFPLVKSIELTHQQAGPVINWDVKKPAPFTPRESVRFVCVDIEAYEKNTAMVTEVGLAVLDTEDINGIPPGERGEDWFPLVQAYHFRIKERDHMVNSDYVRGCPEQFGFG